MTSIFLHALLFRKPLGYLLAFFGMMVGGDETLFILAFLTRDGFFHFWLMAATIATGTFIGDYFWFILGKMLSPYSRLSRIIARFTGRFDRHLNERPFTTIFISKFVYCLNHAMLFRAGALGISQKQLIKSNVPAIAIWILVVGSLGYFSSASLTLLKHSLRYTEIALIVGLIIFIFAERIASYVLKKELENTM